MKKNIAFYLKFFAGLVLLPAFLFLYMADRAVLVFLPWVQQTPLIKTFRNVKLFVPILYRVVTVFIVYLLIKWL